SEIRKAAGIRQWSSVQDRVITQPAATQQPAPRHAPHQPETRKTAVSERRLNEQVRIVGSGLLGASIGLGLRDHGVDVIVADVSPSAQQLGIDYGAGRAPAEGDKPGLIVVAVPPDVTARVVAAELAVYPNALVTDVASVKLGPLEQLRAM